MGGAESRVHDLAVTLVVAACKTMLQYRSRHAHEVTSYQERRQYLGRP